MIVNENMTVTWNLQRERGVRTKNPLYVCVCVCVFERGGGGAGGILLQQHNKFLATKCIPL